MAVIITNAAGYLLKYLNLDDYLILLGFRLKLNLVLPFFFFLTPEILSELKKNVTESVRNKFILQFLLTMLPALILIGVFYTINKIDLGDPEYFYEFGLSSVFDFPIYFIWNLPQLFLFIMITHYIAEKLGVKYVMSILIVLLMSAYTFIPVKSSVFNPGSIIGFIIASVAVGIITERYKNIFSACLSVFFLVWSYFLFFGTGSAEAVQILFAKRFDSWEGLLWIDDKAYVFIPYIYFGISLFGIFPASLLYNNKR